MNRTSAAFVSQSLFSVMVLLMIGGSAGAQDPSTRTAKWQYRPDLLRPYWQTDIVEGESLLFVKDEQSGIARASLLYPVKKILHVRTSAGDVNYEEGRDFLWIPDSREITLPKDSRIPAFTEQQLRRPAGSQKYELTHRDGNGEIFFGSRLEYHEMQSCFTYQHATEGVLPPVQNFDPTALPRTVQRLLKALP